MRGVRPGPRCPRTAASSSTARRQPGADTVRPAPDVLRRAGACRTADDVAVADATAQRAAFALAVAPGSARCARGSSRRPREPRRRLELGRDRPRAAPGDDSGGWRRCRRGSCVRRARGRRTGGRLKAAAPARTARRALRRGRGQRVKGIARPARGRTGPRRWILWRRWPRPDCARTLGAAQGPSAACDVTTHHAVKPVRDARDEPWSARSSGRAPRRQQRSDRDVRASLASRMSVASLRAAAVAGDAHVAGALRDEPSPFVMAEAPVAAPPKVPGLALPVMAPLPAPAPTPALFASDILDDEPRRGADRGGGGCASTSPFKPLERGDDGLVDQSVGHRSRRWSRARERRRARNALCEGRRLRKRASVVRAPANALVTRPDRVAARQGPRRVRPRRSGARRPP